MSWKNLDQFDLSGKRVLTRVDINVPVEDGKVTDTTRIDRIVPTIKDILDKGGKPILMAHFGRPKGKFVPEMSLKITVPALEAALGRTVTFADETTGKTNADYAADMGDGDVLLLENTRFNPAKKQTTPPSSTRWRRWGMFSAMTHFRRRTGRMPLPPDWRRGCRPAPGG